MSKKTSNTTEKATGSDSKQPQFAIQHVRIRDLSFEAPNPIQDFLNEWRPEVSMDLTTKTDAIGEDAHEVVLTVTVTAKVKDKVAFIVEVQQAGIFVIRNFPEDQLKPMLGSFCPNILYPYARQAITNAVMQGGFPQLYLAPVNFDALYQQHEQQEKSKGGNAGAGATA